MRVGAKTKTCAYAVGTNKVTNIDGAWGEVAASVQLGGGVGYTFTGQEEDAESGLMNYRARLYDPALGRFLGVDPQGQFASPYLYGANSPTMTVDPDGEWVHIAAGAVVGGLFNIGLQAYHGRISSLGDVAKFGAVGAVAGAVTAATGGAAGTGIAGGMLGGGTGGAILGGGNAIAGGVTNAGQIATETLTGAAFGAVTGGVAGGVSAYFRGANLWTGRVSQGWGSVGFVQDGVEYVMKGEGKIYAVRADGKLEFVAQGLPTGSKGVYSNPLAGADEVVSGKVTPLSGGPLADDIASTFRSGTYTQVRLGESITLYRVYSAGGNAAGSYWTPIKPNGPLQSVIDSALDQNWGNTATRFVEATIPRGTTIYHGFAAAQRGLVGGGAQVYIPRVNPSWITGGGAF